MEAGNLTLDHTYLKTTRAPFIYPLETYMIIMNHCLINYNVCYNITGYKKV